MINTFILSVIGTLVIYYILIQQRDEIGSKTYVRPTKPAKGSFSYGL